MRNPPRDYAEYHGPYITGVIYADPDKGTGGGYILHCGSTYSFNNQEYDGPNFILKVGQSQDIPQRLSEHRSNSSSYNKGTVNFLFGLKCIEDGRVNAEYELLKKLTELGLARPV
ncbi:hypothetical protein P3T76_014924 [Phytophthora citrophthora]|uniref:Bacteriophage T5 Orf172 DNA-binding domain-containing protein n=1 Tax=Phytophthora citrophthora TaxID=4793 RepID=A0AAD9LAR0_9STRA|nr:hypothetical protein P3T76_014924 [Phytophthora citrophthora]